MKKRGFTLVELISVVTLIGIISVLVTATVINQIKKSENKIDEVTKKLIYSASDLYLETREKDFLKINNNIYCIQLKDLVNDKKLENPIIDSNGDEVSLNKYVRVLVKKNQYKYKVVNSCSRAIVYKETELHGADPELSEGMIPITITNEGVATVADIYDETNPWYEYGQKKWANVVTVTASSRPKYINNEGTYKNGIEVSEGDILTYLTWIPRYKYKLWNVDNMATTGVDASKVHSIDIVFENKNTYKSNGSTNGTYLTHPAFTFGNVELNGMWVGKFETGYNGAVSTTEEYNVTAPNKVVIKPNRSSWRNIQVANAFYTAFGMKEKGNVYGLSSDSDPHVMKNTEWGAVVYLTHSKYGINGKVRYNNNHSFKTGCGALKETYEVTGTCYNQYGTVSTYPQSTTGNITGIFDMAGGAWENVMAVMESISGTLYSGRDSSNNSGFNGKLSVGTMLNGKEFPDSKYYDKYEYNISAAGWSKRILGDATGELGPFNTSESYTSSWYDDSAYFVYPSSPWFFRGSYYATTQGVFYFNANYSYCDQNYSFRVVIANN